MPQFVIQVNNMGLLLNLTKIIQNKLISCIVVTEFTYHSPAKVFEMRTRDSMDIPMACWIGKINPCNEYWTVGSPQLVVEIGQKLFQTGTGKVVFLFEYQNRTIHLVSASVLETDCVGWKDIQRFHNNRISV